MSVEGLDNISDQDFKSHWPEALDVYLSDLPTGETYDFADGIISGKNVRPISEMLMLVREAVRNASNARGALVSKGSIFKEVLEKSPETIEALPEDQKKQIMELVGRMAAEPEKASE